jgi:hypothetical protein
MHHKSLITECTSGAAQVAGGKGVVIKALIAIDTQNKFALKT